MRARPLRHEPRDRRAPRCTGSSPLGPHLDKARGCEVAIEREGLGQPPSAHHSEARGVHERVLPLIVAVEPPPRFFFYIDRYVQDIDGLRPCDEATSLTRGGVAVTPPQKSPDLAQNMVTHE